MKDMAMVIALLILIGCGGSKNPEGPGEDFYVPDLNTRGYQWVFNNRPQVSALMVSIQPNIIPAIASEYWGPFNATAVHTNTQALPTTIQYWRQYSPGNEFRYIAWLELDGTSAGKLIGGLNLPSLNIGYQYFDEPSRGCDDFNCASGRLNQINQSIANVRTLDPNHLAIVNFKKSEWSDELIEQYGETMDGDILSYDYYTYGADAYKFLNSYRNYGMKYSMPHWKYLKAFCYADNGCDVSASNMRWDMWSSLAYGYTGLTWFIYNIDLTIPNDDIETVLFEGPSPNFTKTMLWFFLAELNQEAEETINITRQCANMGVRYAGGSAPSGIRSFKPMEFGMIQSLQTEMPVIVGYFKHFIHNERLYAIIQSQNRSGSGSEQDGEVTVNGSLTFTLKAGEGKLIQF